MPLPLPMAPALIAAAPSLRDEKAAALLAEVAAKGKSLKTLSAEMTMSLTGPQTMKQTGKILVKNPSQGRIELTSDKGQKTLVISDGKFAYSITDKRYTKLPAMPDAIWPFLLGVPGEDPKKLGYVGTEKLDETTFDVLERKESSQTLRIYISPEKLIQRFKMSVDAGGQKIVQEIVLTKVLIDTELAAESLALPAGVEEARPEGMDALEAKLIPLGAKAPAFSLATPTGSKLSLTQALKGKKAVLVNFWFVGCPPCRAEHPELQKLYGKLKAQGFGLVGVNQGDDSKAITRYLKKAQLTFPVVKALPGTIRAYGVQAFPTNYLLDARGKVLYRSVGFDEAKLRAALAKAGLK